MDILSTLNSITNQAIMIHIEKQGYEIKIDNEFIYVGEDFDLALDILFKSFWVFDISYPKEASYFYNFLENIIKEDTNDAIDNFFDDSKPIITELYKFFKSY